MFQKTNKNIPRTKKYILENILLNIFKFYILKYIIKFLQSQDNNNKKNLAFIVSRNTCKKLAEHRLRTSGVDTLGYYSLRSKRDHNTLFITFRLLIDSPLPRVFSSN